MATRIPYETYHDAQCDRFFNPPPQEDTLKEMLCRDSEVEQVPYRKIDWWKTVSVYGSAFVCGALWVAFFWLGGFVSHWVLSPFS